MPLVNQKKKMPRNISNRVISSSDVYLDLGQSSTIPTSKNPLMVEKVNNVLKKSIIQPGFETLERVPGCKESLKQRKRELQKERAKCKGPEWFNMRTPKVTKEIQDDLRVLHMRSVLDPKHFYKKNDIKGLPKYFQVGKYVDSPADFYSSRLPKKQRKKTLVEELMADVNFQKYNKRKHKELVLRYKQTHGKAHQHAKRLKKKNKKQ